MSGSQNDIKKDLFEEMMAKKSPKRSRPHGQSHSTQSLL
jgi:hypothetical protein